MARETKKPKSQNEKWERKSEKRFMTAMKLWVALCLLLKRYLLFMKKSTITIISICDNIFLLYPFNCSYKKFTEKMVVIKKI